jgi:glucan phosphoethanolaminetransferase (alkaline phosphatase superfamily)
MVISSGMLVLLILGLATSYLASSKLKAVLNTLYTLLWSFFVFFLVVFYCIVLVGKKQGVGVLPFKVLYSHLKSFDAVLALAGIQQNAAWGVSLCCLLLLLLLARYIYTLLPQSHLALKDYVRKSINVYSETDKKSKKTDLILVAVFLVALVVMYIRATPLQRLQGAHEPIATMIFGETQYMGMFHFANYKEPASVRANYPKSIISNKKNVILIIVDALRADELSLYGYSRYTSPFLQQLYNEKKLQKIDYAFSTSSASFPGILSILRGKPAYNLAYHNYSLSEVLKDQGYQVNYILSGDHANWYDMQYFYGKDIDLYFDGRYSEKYVCDDNLLFEGLNKVDHFKDKPAFFYLHLMSVHYAGTKDPEFVRWKPVSVEWEPVPYRNNYDNGVLAADHTLERLFRELKVKGYLDNSIVVITADHGESLGERNTYGHIKNVYNEEIRIPILFYDSDTSVHYNKHDVAEQPDIAATIVDRLGLPKPSTWEGVSLLRDSFPEFTFHSVSNDYAMIHRNGAKLYAYCYNALSKKEELFDMRNDPHEEHNLLDQTDANYVATLRKKMKEYLALHQNY